MINLKLNGTPVFEKNYDEWQSKKHRFVVNEGGTGSSKTYSIAQLFLIILIKEKNAHLTICRNNLPQLRASAMKDFFDIMEGAGIYKEDNHNKTERIYRYGSNEVNFISVEESRKLRSQKREYLWINEANEMALESYRQLNMRTKKQVFMDYNPSDEYHWIYDHVLNRPETKLIHSTYLDNPYLDPQIIKEIEHYKGLDKNYWRIYGLGERGITEMKIYSHWQYCDKLPNNPDEIIYGLDFGYNNPAALVRIDIKDKANYWKQLLYKSFLTDPQLIEQLKELVPMDAYLYADAENPQAIELIRQAGFNVKPTSKEAGSVMAGIKVIKANEWFITKDSDDILKEAKSYSWKEKDGKPLDEPVKVNDHLLDGGRGAIYTHTVKPKIQLF